MSQVPFLTFEDAPAGLAAEMDMLDAVAGGAPAAAFLWQVRRPWLVLPERFARGDVFEAAARESTADGWPVAPRRTGGGITPQGPGVLNLALAFTTPPGKSRTVRDSYGAICDPLAEALTALGVATQATPVTGSFCDGDYNLAVEGRKIVGTAQRWRGGTCLCHALLLTDIDMTHAVSTVQRLSDGLGHGHRFDRDVHTRLADLVEDTRDLTARTADAIWQAVGARGYAAWA